MFLPVEFSIVFKERVYPPNTCLSSTTQDHITLTHDKYLDLTFTLKVAHQPFSLRNIHSDRAIPSPPAIVPSNLADFFVVTPNHRYDILSCTSSFPQHFSFGEVLLILLLPSLIPKKYPQRH